MAKIARSVESKRIEKTAAKPSGPLDHDFYNRHLVLDQPLAADTNRKRRFSCRDFGTRPRSGHRV